ncbi:MAG TPA: polysaccharide biosynthesis tyrosine autokinase [Candidatus Aminicenantes bacterium]|nr:polysaccharide biosynthesis tyrosine autokinase [Candidatus Aminicenantes bacterium]HRY64865.1 polysaccharide biosynthesis tyrosine autokinase [Candidatus Aminicenantes bacterium]HRZ71778.1 polysaccharide biosynthesis tyrosine autokinase [Candidatus Aminicenantes bacterium]
MPEPAIDHKEGLLAQVRQYGLTVLRWKWVAASFFAAVVLVAAGLSFLIPSVYMAHGSIWIEGDSKILPFEDVQSFNAGTNLQSHARLLRSRTLAADVIDRLKLYENPDYMGGLPPGERKAPDPADPAVKERLVQDFLKNVSVSSNERTSLVDVSFSSRNPRLAADILNALFDAYIDMIVRKRYSASEKATEFLNAQIIELRTEIETREKELNRYGSEKDILPLTAAEAPTVSRISEVNSALTAATLDKINKLNYYNQLKAAPLGEVPDAPAGSMIQTLREQYLALKRQYANRLAFVRPEYPEMQRLKSELDLATESLQVETQNLIRNALADYQTALAKEQSLQRLLNEQKNEAYKVSGNAVVYNSLRIELENKKTLLETLSRRQSETDVSSRLKGLEALNVWIVDKADFPLKPAFPNKRRNILIGILIGLGGGIGIALGIEYLNHSVKTSKDIAATVGLPTLGSIPAFEDELRPKGPKAEFKRLFSILLIREQRDERPRRRARRRPDSGLPESSVLAGDPPESRRDGGRMELIASREPQSIQAESYRSLRTTLLVSSPPGRVKSILMTSPLAREGKSTTVSNLGITLAEANKKVLIIDSDLRKPRQARIFGIRNNHRPGLSNYLSDRIEIDAMIQPTGHANLDLISSGPLPANPIELIASDAMDNLVANLKRRYDYLLFDAPPVLAVSDALALGPMVDAIILVARGGHTPKQAMRQAKQKLDAHKLKCLGVVLNGIDLVEQDGYYARQYYKYADPE